ncbi:MAG: NAD(P)-binding domain-containing protein, partial [Caldimonas sp.]
MTKALRVGVIGIGAMGYAIARNLQAKAYPLLVRDIDPAAVAAAAALGIEAAISPADLGGRSDVILIVVVDAAQIEAVLFGADGVVHADRGGSDGRLAVLLCSTIAAEDTERFGERLASLGIDVLDAPISGGPA